MDTPRNPTTAIAIVGWLALLAIGVAAVTSVAATDDSPDAAEAATVVAARVPPRPTRRLRAVFVCVDGGVPVYADRPCGSVSPSRAILIETPGAGATFVTAPPAPRASTRPAPVRRTPEPVPHEATSSRCDALERQLDEVNSRMRAGYSAREAARLWQRWRDLKERLHAARC